MAEKQQTNEPNNEDRVIINLALEPYLAQWLRCRYGGCPVEFPRNSAENDILEMFLAKPPIFASNNSPGENRVPILVPWFRNKNVRYNNYLSSASRRALAQCIRSRFVLELWKDLSRFSNIGRQIQDIIWACMETHGIEMTDTNWNTIVKIYMRKRKVYVETVRREKSKKAKQG